MTSNLSPPNVAGFRVADADPPLRNPVSPGRNRGVVAAFATLFCIFAIANALPLILAAAGIWQAAEDFYAYAQWRQWMGGTSVAEAMLIPLVLLIEGPQFWKLCLAAIASYAALLLMGFAVFLFQYSSAISNLWNYDVEVAGILYTGMFVSLAATFAHFRLIRGWRLVGREWCGTLPPPRIVRFTLQQMFIATAAFGGLLALRSYFASLFLIIIAVIISQAAGLPLLATLTLLLGTRGNRMTTLIDWGLISSVVLFLCAVLAMDTGSGRQITSMFVSWYAVCVVSLLWLRLWGLRLRCAGPSDKTGAQTSDHTVSEHPSPLFS